MRLSEKFSRLAVIRVFLIVVLGSIVGFTSWYVWHAQQASTKLLQVNDVASSSISTSTKNQPQSVGMTPEKPLTKQITLPVDWSWYTNEDYGFKVAHPNAWVVEQALRQPGITGNSVYVDFAYGPKADDPNKNDFTPLFRVQISLKFDTDDYSREACNDSGNCRIVGPYISKTEIERTLKNIVGGLDSSNDAEPIVGHDDYSYININTNIGDPATDELINYSIVNLPKLNVSAAYTSMDLYEVDQNCTQKAVSAESTHWCIKQSDVDTIQKVTKSLQQL